MRDLANIEAVAACEPDYMGFIWVEKSPRYVGPDFVIPTLSAKTQAVGVFVNESVANILALSKKAGFQVVQLHGEEGQEEINTLRDAGLVVIKAVSVATEADMLGLDLNPDFYLFDEDLFCVYRGQFDDSRPSNNEPVTGEDLCNAIDALLANQPPVENQHPSLGCSIKWRE